MKKQELLSQLQNNHECFFSLNQVIEMISKIEDAPETQSTKLTEEILKQIGKKFYEEIKSEIYNVDTDDLVDKDGGIEISVSYREICVDSVEVDLDLIYNAIRYGIDNCISEIIEEQEEQEQEESEEN